MTLTRRLLLILAAGLFGVWAVISLQLHFSVTANFRDFDTYTRDSTRAHIAATMEQTSLRLHSDGQHWLAANAAGTAAGLAALPEDAPQLTVASLREADTISLFDTAGNLVWSAAYNTAPWSDTTLRDGDGKGYPFGQGQKSAIGTGFFVAGPGGPQLAAAMPVKDRSAGTVDGYLVLARTLDRFFYDDIARAEDKAVLATTIGKVPVPSLLRDLLDDTLDANERFELEQRTGATYVRLDDAFGRPLVLLGVSSPRFSATLPTNPGIGLLIAISAATVIFLLLLSGVIERLVGQPLRQLRERIIEMNTGQQPLSVGGQNNEILAIHDMFEQMAAEREKRESSLRHFASAVNAADDAVAIVNGKGQLHYVNPGYEKLTGHSADYLIGNKSWWDIVFATNVMTNRQNGESEWEGEIQIRRADGTLREVEAKTYKLDNEEGEEVFFVIVMHDVTEKNAQIAEIQRLATAVKTIEDCIIIADREGRIIYANPAYEKRCGRPLAEMIGVQTNQLSHATSPASVYEDLQATVTAGKAWRGELSAAFPDGRTVIDEAVVSPVINEQGEIVNYVTTLHDVTQRVSMAEDLRLANARIEEANDDLEARVTQRTEELRDAKEAAEKANVAKSAFLATVSHEIRTPLNGVLGMLELLQDHSLNNQAQRLLASADTSATLLLALINDILDFSKIEAGELVLDETSVPLRETTESVILSLAGTAHRKNLRLQSTLDPALPPFIRMDGVRMQQILLNLLGNALKFTSSDGKQGIVSLHVDSVEQNGRQMLRMRVKDNGIGIPPDAMNSLFKPFTQAETSTTRRFGGTGLGLTISARLAGLMGGGITVDSTLGKGSEFTVVLPLTAAEQSSAKRVQRSVRTGKKDAKNPWPADQVRGHILVAEDNPINQQVIQLQLKAIGFTCDVANDGASALTLWRKREYDLVLTDCHMPNMDGFELARSIRSHETADSHIPIVALTANVLSEEAERCRAAGMDDCLTKPIDRSLLDKSLSVHLTTRALTRTAATKPKQSRDGMLDMAVFASNIGDDVEVQHELLRRFAIEAKNNLTESRAAYAQRDAAALECNAHKLKSAARTLGADRLADTCVEIERKARSKDFVQIEELLEQKAMLIKMLDGQIMDEIGSSNAQTEALSPQE